MDASRASAKCKLPTAKRLDYTWSTLALLCGVCIVQGADDQLLPGSLRALERTLGVSPADLSLLGIAQAITQGPCGLVWVGLVDSGVDRKSLLLGGVFAWAALTLMMALVRSYWTMLLLRFLNGAAVSCMLPVSQSIVADISQPAERGSFFGLMQMFSYGGILGGQFFTTLIANTTLFGLPGWRVAFLMFAGLSCTLGLCMAVSLQAVPSPVAPTEFESTWCKMAKYSKLPTFRYLVLQGVCASVSWSAMTFMTMFYQYVGMTDLQAATITATFLIGAMVGSLVGGLLGDSLNRWDRIHGRPLTAQISFACGTPLAFIALHVVPRTPSSYLMYLALAFLCGVTVTWGETGVDRPMMTELAGPEDAACVIACREVLDGTFGAFLGAPVVGILAEEVLGYRASKMQVSAMPAAQRQQNAATLGMALLLLTMIPWTLCFMFYSMMHYTYETDLNHAPGGEQSRASPSETTSLIAARQV